MSAPVAVPVDLSVEIEPGENHTPEETMASVSAALGKFFSGELLGKNVLLAELGQVIFSAKGVKNYRITAPDSDISVQSGELPVMGTLTLSAMGA